MNTVSFVNSPRESQVKTITSQQPAIGDVRKQEDIFNSNRAKYYSFNERYADCIFIVGSSKTKILGIRVLFAIQSEYFDALLFNTFFNSKPINCDNSEHNDEFKPTFYEPDVSIETFEFIMKYCYGIHDKLYITLDNVFEIYYASQKYLINPLASKCEQFIACAIKPSTTSINDIIKLYCFAIKRSCPALADKIEKKLKTKLVKMDNTNVMIAFMDIFKELVSHNKLDGHLKLMISHRDQHVFNILLYALLTRKKK